MDRQRIAQELVAVARELTAETYIDAYTLEKAHKNIDEAKRIVKSEMPRGKFVFVGVDSKFIYFNVVARLGETNEAEMEDIKVKTRFMLLSEDTRSVYKGEFKMRIM